MSAAVGSGGQGQSRDQSRPSSTIPDFSNDPHRPQHDSLFLSNNGGGAGLVSSDSPEDRIEPAPVRPSYDDHPRDEKVPMPPLPLSDHPAFRTGASGSASTSSPDASSSSAAGPVIPGSYRQPSQQGFVLPFEEDVDEDVPLGHRTQALRSQGTPGGPVHAHTAVIGSGASLNRPEETSLDDILPPPPSYEQATSSSAPSSRHGGPPPGPAIPLRAFPPSAGGSISPTSTSHLITNAVSPATTSPLSLSAPSFPRPGGGPPQHQLDTSNLAHTGTAGSHSGRVSGDEPIDGVEMDPTGLKRRKRKKLRLCVCIIAGSLLFVIALIIGITIGLLKGRHSDDDGDDGSNGGNTGSSGSGGTSGGGTGGDTGSGAVDGGSDDQEPPTTKVVVVIAGNEGWGGATANRLTKRLVLERGNGVYGRPQGLDEDTDIPIIDMNWNAAIPPEVEENIAKVHQPPWAESTGPYVILDKEKDAP